MALTILVDALTSGVTWNTIGCIIVVPILVACLHYCRYRCLQDTADCAAVDETIYDVFFDQQDQQQLVEEEQQIEAVVTNSHNKNIIAEIGHFNETDDNLGFDAYYDEREDEEDDEDFLLEEVVEISFDLGSFQGNVSRFLSRMHRVTI